MFNFCLSLQDQSDIPLVGGHSFEMIVDPNVLLSKAEQTRLLPTCVSSADGEEESATKDDPTEELSANLLMLSVTGGAASPPICEPGRQISIRAYKSSSTSGKLNEILDFLGLKGLFYELRSWTEGMGNCFFFGIVDQLSRPEVLANVPAHRQASCLDHQTLRSEVVTFAQHSRFSSMPHVWVGMNDYIKEREAIEKQKNLIWEDCLTYMAKPGTWVENIFIHFTAWYLNKDIWLGAKEYPQTGFLKIDGTLEGVSNASGPPITLAYLHNEHFQSIHPIFAEPVPDQMLVDTVSLDNVSEPMDIICPDESLSWCDDSNHDNLTTFVLGSTSHSPVTDSVLTSMLEAPAHVRSLQIINEPEFEIEPNCRGCGQKLGSNPMYHLSRKSRKESCQSQYDMVSLCAVAASRKAFRRAEKKSLLEFQVRERQRKKTYLGKHYDKK
jgi:hypothetical protein